jgi:hypothetical protein
MDGRWTVSGKRVALKRLAVLVGAVVLVDRMFYAALTPLLPHYVHELGLSKSGAGVLAGAYAAGSGGVRRTQFRAVRDCRIGVTFQRTSSS